ncbi:uncharacterized protein LOC123695079 [Colias croceus]|uniref:uncharacterized protein LOC123695079 n=1 Tax=Colias crocea TaxID=72248 RepID=UPI001E27B877|nr:uncharacterized protein LOC123695079 [Colias croceus]
MRQTFISIMLLFAVAVTARGSDLGKDGFNYYKDYLRARSDDIYVDSPFEDRVIYFFRTPLQQLYPDLPVIQEYRKRTANIFKNHMLNREPGGVPNKRTSKTGLSLLMQSKQDSHPTSDDEHYCLYGK